MDVIELLRQAAQEILIELGEEVPETFKTPHDLVDELYEMAQGHLVSTDRWCQEVFCN